MATNPQNEAAVIQERENLLNFDYYSLIWLNENDELKKSLPNDAENEAHEWTEYVESSHAMAFVKMIGQRVRELELECYDLRNFIARSKDSL